MFQKVFASLSAFAALFLTSSIAFASEGSAYASEAGWFAIAAGIGMGLAVFGGAFGQSRAASAALEGISRNPNAADKVFVPMILGLAFIESLVLFAMVIMFMILGKI
ncbi:ATP synthase F0 subunit C [Myxococcota bacterium]|nr:ATP synthase F0 subunit C [Myxococcota bacterium]